MTRIANRDARDYVLRKEPFESSNIFAQWSASGIYTVYSFGSRFHIYVFSAKHEMWIGNRGKYSVTTSKHQSQTRPPNVKAWFATDAIVRASRSVDNFIDVVMNNGKEL